MHMQRGKDRKQACSLVAAGLALGWAVATPTVAASQAVTRILEQDPALDNLVEPAGYETSELGSLGGVIQRGEGPRDMILIPGLGFAGSVFDPLMDAWNESFSMYAVTLPGFGGTQAYPTPAPETSFGEQTWTRGALRGLIQLIDTEGLEDIVVVGHWLTGTQLAVELAIARPDRVKAVILLAGAARFENVGGANPAVELEQRVAAVDRYWAPMWFKTVTRETWDDNSFLPGDYAASPVMGLRLWRQAAAPSLHVLVRYLCEFFAQDVTGAMHRLEAPALLLRPDFKDVFYDPENHYLDTYARQSWGELLAPGSPLTARKVDGTRIVMWADNLGSVVSDVERFLFRIRNDGGRYE